MFDQPFDANPAPTAPISVDRSEFEEAYNALAAAGIPMRADRDAYAGWRVNYDAVLLRLCGLVMAPYAPWSSDRCLRATVPMRRLRSKSKD